MVWRHGLVLYVAACSIPLQPTDLKISSDVYMPYVNLGGIEELSSNYSSWLELGGRGLDTALIYGDDVQMDVGRAIATSRIPREAIFVTTKIPCAQNVALDPPSVLPRTWSRTHTARWSSGNPAADIERTFDLLGLDYVDLLLLHMPCAGNTEATAAAYKAMEPLIAQGRARALGVSNFNSSDIDALMKVAAVKPVVNQCQFSIGWHDDATVQHCRELGIAYAAYSPLGGLAGIDILHHPVVKQVADSHSKSTAQIALKWVIQQGVAVITSTTSADHQKGDLDIFDFQLSEHEMTSLSALHLASDSMLVVPISRDMSLSISFVLTLAVSLAMTGLGVASQRYRLDTREPLLGSPM